MNLLLFSDSHGHTDYLQALMARVCTVSRPDAILFAGDGIRDAERVNAECQVYRVRGNCDHSSNALDEQLLTFSTHRIYLSHGHLHRVKRTLDLLASAARVKDAKIAVYGHTHRQGLELVNTVYCINPGALINGEYALLRIEEDGRIFPFFHNLKDK